MLRGIDKSDHKRNMKNNWLSEKIDILMFIEKVVSTKRK